MVATPMESPGSPSAFSADGDSTYTGNVGAGKVLRIRRVVSTSKTHVKAILKLMMLLDQGQSRHGDHS